jgi:hypothetical protein
MSGMRVSVYWRDYIKIGMPDWSKLYRGFSLLHPLTVAQINDVLLGVRLTT